MRGRRGGGGGNAVVGAEAGCIAMSMAEGVRYGVGPQRWNGLPDAGEYGKSARPDAVGDRSFVWSCRCCGVDTTR